MGKTKYKAGPVILLTLFAIYLLVLFKITLFRASGAGARNVNAIPFATIVNYIQFVASGSRITGLANLLGNLALFLPLGYLLALVAPKMRSFAKMALISAVFSAAIEGLQYAFACGAADIDDVILNTIGGMMGYGAYIFVSKYFARGKHRIAASVFLVAFICIGFLAADNYTFLVGRPGRSALSAPGEAPYGHSSTSLSMDGAPGPRLSGDAVPSADFHAVQPTSVPDDSDETAWCLVLVNKWNGVPDDYDVQLTQLDNGQAVDARIYPALQELFDAARNDGVYPVVLSGYRTANQQQRLLDEKIAAYTAEGYTAEEAANLAEDWVATPGASEHQLGIAVDINADGVHSAGYDVYDWLDQNAHQFGFIRRYPPDKTDITGVLNEPWHYRYVGVAAATDMQSKGLCLEEYLDGIN